MSVHQNSFRRKDIKNFKRYISNFTFFASNCFNQIVTLSTMESTFLDKTIRCASRWFILAKKTRNLRVHQFQVCYDPFGSPEVLGAQKGLEVHLCSCSALVWKLCTKQWKISNSHAIFAIKNIGTYTFHAQTWKNILKTPKLVLIMSSNFFVF